MDYFNLETSSEEEQPDEKISQEELEKKCQKWDWQNPENFNLYYSFGKKENLKRSLVTYDEEIEETQSDKRFRNDLTIEKSNTKNLIYILHGHKSSVNRINWSKKPFNNDRLLSCSYDSSVILWDLKKSITKKFTHHSKFVRNTIFSNDESSFISISYDQTSCLTDLETGKVISKICHDEVFTSVCAHPNDENLILLGSKNEILLWDLRGSKVTRKYKAKSYIGLIQDILFINETEFVSSGDVISKDSAEYSVIAWDFGSTAIISNQIFHEKYICTTLKKHPFNSIFYAQTHGDYIAEFSCRRPFKMNRHRRFESAGHSVKGYSIGFDVNSSGSLIASGSIDGNVYIFNSSSSKLVKKIELCDKEATKSQALDVKFKNTNNNQNEILAVSYSNGQIKIYNL